MCISKSRYSVATVFGGFVLVVASSLPADETTPRSSTTPARAAQATGQDQENQDQQNPQQQDQQDQDRQNRQNRQRGSSDARDAGREAGRAGRTDSQLAGWLAVSNEGEIAFSKIGQEKSQNQQVKQFAEQMIKDHSEMLAKLQKFTRAEGAGVESQEATTRTESTTRGDARARGERGAVAESDDQPQGDQNRDPNNRDPNNRDPNDRDPNNRDQNDRDQNVADKTETTTTTRTRASSAPEGGAGQAGGRINLVSLKRELGEACLETKRQKLEEKEGAEFDKCFMGMQIAAHMEAIDTMKVFKRHASSDLAQALDEGIQTATGHLQHAEGIMKQLEGKAGQDASTNANRNNNKENKQE